MIKYIDAGKLKRFVESIGLTPQKSADYNDGRDDVKMMVLDFINYIQQEQHEADLEKEISTWIPAHISGGDDGVWNTKNAVIEWAGIVARHFYELGKNSK